MPAPVAFSRKGRAEDELCVPSVVLKGDSFRLRGRELGKVPEDHG